MKSYMEDFEMNNHTMEKLDYYKLKEIVKRYCVSTLGKNLIDKLIPSSNLKNVKRMMNETSEGRNLIDASYHVPLEGISNINPLIDKMEKGSSLEAGDLTAVSDFLRGCRKLKSFIKNKEGYAPTLSSYGESISEFSDIEEEINRCIRGCMVDSNASRELSRIRRNIDNNENKIKEKLDKFLKSSGNKQYIGEFFISKRNGKFTVPIKSSYKNMVSGTIVEVSSFHIGAKNGTEIAVFDDIFVDIGDDQSVSNALSTFSSHVKNLSDILKMSSRNSLLLFDEIGSGTEPNEGAALAIAILEEFYHKGCITVATTHYGEIKNFSASHPDFENAAMEFMKDTLDPLYKLHIGMTGDSNALYISKKMGIADNILKRAQHYINTKDYNYERVKESKIAKKKAIDNKTEEVSFKKGDRVMLLDKNDFGLVYEEIDSSNNITVFYKKQYIKVNYRRLKLYGKASDLYPEGYDLDQLFIEFKDRKLKRDIERGSKKALKKIYKESRI